MSLSGKNLLVQMRAEGNKSLDFWDIPHEGKRQDASHPEGWHSPAVCPSPVPSTKVAVGGLIVSSLCGGPGPQCPAGVCGATNGWCWGGYWCRLHGSHTEGVL